MKILLIINPTSGKGNLSQEVNKIAYPLIKGGHRVFRAFTTGKGSGAELVKKYGAGCGEIICCGGDGTLSEVINGISECGLSVPVGYIPAGTTNDFAHSVGLTGNPEQAARDILNGIPSPFDIGRFQDKKFIYTASFGLFTKSSYATSPTLKKLLGHTAYMLEGSKEFVNLKSYHVRTVDDKGRAYEGDYLFGGVSNSTTLGGLLHLDKSFVDFNDGLFEVILIKFPKTLRDMRKTIRAIASNDLTSSLFELFQTSKVTFYCDKNMPWTLDGEYHAGGEVIEVENLKGAVNLIYPDCEI